MVSLKNCTWYSHIIQLQREIKNDLLKGGMHFDRCPYLYVLRSSKNYIIISICETNYLRKLESISFRDMLPLCQSLWCFEHKGICFLFNAELSASCPSRVFPLALLTLNELFLEWGSKYKSLNNRLTWWISILVVSLHEVTAQMFL